MAAASRRARGRSAGRSRRGRSGSTVSTVTPRARQASTSSGSASSTVTIALTRSGGAKASRAVRDHFLCRRSRPPAARGYENALEADLLRVQVHQAVLEPEPARAEEALVDPRRPQHVAREAADDRQRRAAQDPAGDDDADAGSLRQRRGDQEPARDDDQLPLPAQLEREVVRGRAGSRGRRPSPSRTIAAAARAIACFSRATRWLHLERGLRLAARAGARCRGGARRARARRAPSDRSGS